MRHFDTGYFKKKINKRKFISKKRDITNDRSSFTTERGWGTFSEERVEKFPIR